MKTLIINIGPSGDVVRTTVLLRELGGEIYWLTKDNCVPFLKSKKIKKIICCENPEDIENIENIVFDLIISLNEEKDVLNIVKRLKTKKIIGVYFDKNEKIVYTPESSYWFDMSLASKFGKKRADELKMENRKSLPQILIEMIGKKWNGQEYDLGIEGKNATKKIGIIKEVTGKWPNKGWKYYDELYLKLKNEGYDVAFLGLKPTIEEHIEDINNCEIVVCGDTLGMHIALALKKKVVTLFNCTSPNEIYDYGRLNKIVSPLLEKYFYKKEFNEEAVCAISLEEVYSAVKKALKREQ